ncbi:MAG: hypothetical protein ACE37K_23065 [Planctomycetota bacterium]
MTTSSSVAPVAAVWAAICLLALPIAAQRGLSTRIYDVQALAWGDIEFAPYEIRDLPSLDGRVDPASEAARGLPRKSEAGDDPIAGIELADLVDNLQHLTDYTYWLEEGVEIRTDESRLLMVTCNPEMHEMVASVLDRMRGFAMEQVLIEVYELPGGAVAGRQPVLDGTRFDALLQASQPRRMWFGRGAIGCPICLESGARRQAGEEAADSAWEVRANRTHDGKLLVALAARTGSGAVRASGILNNGQGLLVGANTAGGHAICLRLRRLAPVEAWIAPSPIEESTAIGDLGRLVLPVGALVANMPGAARPVPRSGVDDAPLFPEIEKDSAAPVIDESRLIDLLTSTIEPDKWDGSPFTMSYQNGLLLARCDTDAMTRIRGMVDALARHQQRQYSLELRFGTIAGERSWAALADKPDDLEKLLNHACLAIVGPHRGFSLDAGVHRDSPGPTDRAKAMSPGENRDGLAVRARIACVDEHHLKIETVLEHTRWPEGSAGHEASAPVRHRVRGTAVLETEAWHLLHVAPGPGSMDHFVVAARLRRLDGNRIRGSVAPAQPLHNGG